MTAYFGKYRGKVENNVDPSQLGRLQVSVPAVLGSGQNSWAMPCTPYAGSSVGWFALPPVNSDVWVEFEQGDPDYPIWSGCSCLDPTVFGEDIVFGVCSSIWKHDFSKPD